MESVAVDKYKKKIITIPNILSFVRICLIPVIIWLYLGKEDYLLAGIFVLISGLTDIVDGFIARTFNMISDVGKVLDPVADKATQAIVMILLATSFPLMLIPIILTIIKEAFMGISGYLIIKKCNIVLGAHWYGKAATVFISIMMALHLFWHDINPTLSLITIIVSSLSILLALVLYAIRNFGYLFGKKQEQK